MGTAIIQSKLLVDEHPNVVIAAEGEFLIFVIGEGGVAFEAELLITGHASPVLTGSPIPNSRIIAIPEQAFAIFAAVPTIGIAVFIKITRVDVGNGSLGLSLGTADVAGYRADVGHEACRRRPFERIEPSRIPPHSKFVTTQVVMGGIRISFSSLVAFD